eukprot:TRINITY_DN11200_c0_g1_i3.p2 TRINITY_DN11200_c0_g1~~TRINITY_DN11200_c0_g1_i3.p2  ORF type:complete len:109 (-),score=30.62 TRINITY_DN11200_c0_g1_i3:205-531(-)
MQRGLVGSEMCIRDRTETDRKVTHNEGIELGGSAGLKCLEASALTGVGIQEIFEEIGEKILEEESSTEPPMPINNDVVHLDKPLDFGKAGDNPPSSSEAPAPKKKSCC